MQAKKKLSSGVQIAITLSGFSVLCIAVTAFSAFSIHKLTASSGRLSSHYAGGLSMASAVTANVGDLHRLSFEMNQAEPGQLAVLEREADAENAQLKASLGRLRTLVDEHERPLYEEIAKDVGDYEIIASEIRRLRNQGDAARAEALLISSADASYDNISAALRRLTATQTRDLAEATAKTKRDTTKSLAILLIISAAVLGLVLRMNLVVMPREIEAMRRMAEGMKRLASGDLEADVELKAYGGELEELRDAFGLFRQAALDKRALEATAEQQRQEHEAFQTAHLQRQKEVVDALGAALSRLASGDLVSRIAIAFPSGTEQLRDDFNAAVDQLQAVIRQLKTSASGIQAGADEISQSAEDLSRRTEQQAASLEESAAALDQITNTIRRTADASVEASNAVLTVKADAERSGKVVRDAVGAMSQIEQSSRQIGQIIGVIDEIAFQTNLLALNAGVEAARAGDAGRGFAVVASEVRALAQRSAAAAKEIKALISTSNDQVETGVQLVGQTGEALERILTSIAEINKLVAGFAASANEQAAGLHEVNSAIDQMDHATQQNASMVQESTAASFALASEAQQLARLISGFEIGASAEPAAQPRRLREAPPARRAPPPSTGGASAAARHVEVAEGEWEEF